MNILILTPSNPVCILDMISKIGPMVKDEVGFNSINISALYQEQNDIENAVENPITYPVALYSFAKALSSSQELVDNMFKNENNIIVGNLDKNTPIKFDHILGFEVEPWSLDPDLYLEEGDKLFKDVFLKTNIQPVEWYTKNDAHHIFPTLHHLSVMLNVLGVVNYDSKSTVQSTPN